MPAVDPSTRERLAVWEEFARTKRHILKRGDEEWPANKILLQLACEHADESPVTEGAEAWLDKDNCDWLWLKKPHRPASGFSTACERVLEGHRGQINEVYELPDGNIVSSADELFFWGRQSGIHARISDNEGMLPNGYFFFRSNEGAQFKDESGKILDVRRLHQESSRPDLATSSGEEIQKLSNGRFLVRPRRGAVMSLREYHNHASEDEISEDWEEVHDALTQFDFADLDLMKTVSYLEGHMDQVLGAAELRDGSIISWGKDHLLIIWDSHGSYPMDLGHHALVIQGCLNMEGGRGITWSCDHTLKIWDLETMELIRTLKGHGSAVQGALCALEGQYLLSWSDHHDTDGGELLLHDLNNDSCWKLKERGEVNGAIELANGHVLTWGEDDTLRVWDLNCCVEVNSLNTEEETTFGPDGWFASFAIQLKDGRILATLIHGGLIIWDPESDSCTEIDPSITGARQLEDGTILCWSGNGLSIFQPTAPHGIAPLTRTPDTKGVIIMADRLTDGRYIALDDNGVITFWSDGATPELTSVEKTFSKDPKIWGHCVKMANELYARHRWHFHAPTPIRLLHSLQESTLEESALFAAGNRQGRVSLFMPGHPGAVFWEDERRYWFTDSYFLPYYGGQLDEPGDEVFMLVQDLSVDGRLLMTGGRKLRVMELYHGNRRVDLSEAAGLLAAQED